MCQFKAPNGKMQFLKECLSKGYLFESSLLQLFYDFGLGDNELSEISGFLLQLNPPKIITKNFFYESLEKLLKNELSESSKTFLERSSNVLGVAEINNKENKEGQIKPLNAEEKDNKKRTFYPNNFINPYCCQKFEDVEVKDYLISTKKITVQDFVRVYRSRFNFLKGLLMERGLQNLTSINKISSQKRNVSVIGLIFDKRVTKNKNVLLDIEDSTGHIAVLIRHDKSELFEKTKSLLLDEVVAVSGVGNDEIIFANDLVTVDIAKEMKYAQEESYAAFISDMHVGSLKFLQDNFLRFIDWLNGEIGSKKQREIAKRVRYLFILGDNVDGVGVYPKQDLELLIKDVKEQYHLLAELLSKIRKDVIILMCPGGKHDAVRHIEPQPKISEEMAPDLYKIDNLILTTNPCEVKIASTKTFSGFNVLMYHGDSYDYFMDSVESLRMNNAKQKPDMIMHLLLKKRHLAPSHTSTTYFPGDQDMLTIEKVPDILVSGHIHKSAVSYYNGILTISCSCWQSKTGYQEKFGHEPDPCKVPLLNLKTGKINILDFS